MKTLPFILFFLTANCLADNIFDSGCTEVTFYAKLHLICMMPDGTTQEIPMVTTTSTSSTSTAPTTTTTTTATLPPSPINCTLTYSTFNHTLYAGCIPEVNGYKWTGAGCDYFTGFSCPVNPLVTTTYSVVGYGALGASNPVYYTVIK